MTAFDYIIVGAGSAGCVLAHRLSADPARTVLLIEAGGSDAHPFIRMPRGLARVIGDPRFIWPHMTEAEAASNDAAESWARGRTLGGSSAINGMMYVRGQDADFDDFAAETSADWAWEKMAAAYRALENHELGGTESRGGAGPLHISMPTERGRLTQAAIAAGEALGLTAKADVNDPDDVERIGYCPRTIHRGRRVSAANAFLEPVRGRSNLTVLTDTVVDRLLFEGGRAVAVLTGDDGGAMTWRARREIILSAGALASPAILQRSGIGPAAHLEALGIPLVHDSPEVGANLREHRGVVMQWRVRDDLSENTHLRGIGLAKSVARYALFRTGPMTHAAFEVGAWVKGAPGANRPDGQILLAPYSFDMSGKTLGVERGGGLGMCVYPLRPESRGTVTIRSADSAALPRIQPNFGSAERDGEMMVHLMRYARRLAATPPLADLIIAETRPGPAYQTDEELRAAHRQFGYANYHACGTCRAGRDAASPVDPALKVRGAEGLRVVDTSVFPFMLAGNTNAPAMAVAWRAADLILAEMTERISP